jgi:hypothetical protein
MTTVQKVDLYQPILHATNTRVPLTLRVAAHANTHMVEGGVPETSLKSETYVLLSALPKELQQRVVVAVQALIAGM